MGFWPKLCCAVVCWFASMLTLIVTAAHYIPPTSPPTELWAKILLVLVVGVGAIATLVAVLAFWLWVWTRRYWD